MRIASVLGAQGVRESGSQGRTRAGSAHPERMCSGFLRRYCICFICFWLSQSARQTPIFPHFISILKQVRHVKNFSKPRRAQCVFMRRPGCVRCARFEENPCRGYARGLPDRGAVSFLSCARSARHRSPAASFSGVETDHLVGLADADGNRSLFRQSLCAQPDGNARAWHDHAIRRRGVSERVGIACFWDIEEEVARHCDRSSLAEAAPADPRLY